MANICLTFSTRAPAAKILDALTTIDGLKAWWTQGVSGNPDKGGTLLFRFTGDAGFDMHVAENNEEQVIWECVRGPDDWLGTRIEFTLSEDKGRNRLSFRHAGWKTESPHFHGCSMKWATFMLSLRDLVETGEGRPFPNDVQIDAAA